LAIWQRLHKQPNNGEGKHTGTDGIQWKVHAEKYTCPAKQNADKQNETSQLPQACR